MTTLRSVPARKRASLLCAMPFGSLRSAILISFATLALGGCESGSNILSGGGITPQPIAATTPTSPISTARIQIAPVIGSPDNVARDLQSQLASSIARNGVTVATAPNATGEYVIRGYVVAAREKTTNAKISYIWDVTDQSGKRVHRITGEEVAKGGGKDPWAAVTPQVVQAISDKTASQIASWLPGGSGVPMASSVNPGMSGSSSKYASNAPASDVKPSSENVALNSAAPSSAPSAPTTGSIEGPVTALVPLVTGAPGDGSNSLTTAIQRELSKNGIPLTSYPTASTYKVEGKVAMGQGKDGKQPIQIDWNVIDPKGKKLGTVSQKNEVPQGSLDGAWGRTADAAAAAATQGIIKLLPKSTN